ncbi:MAG: AraC family transcriptional regulator [Spirochaetaceae bacterium]|nr:MAG: AraC family transcriptional regulator [Spirochaetaceae bacterium]
MLLLTLVAMLGSVQGLLLLILIGARFRCRLNVPFAILLLLFSIRLGTIPFWTPHAVSAMSWVLTLVGPLPLLFGPLVWWYVRNLVAYRDDVPRLAVVHAIPWIVETAALVVIIYSMSPGEYRSLVGDLFSDSSPWWMIARHVIKILHGGTYAVVVARIAFGRESRAQVGERARLIWARIVVLAPLLSMLSFAVATSWPAVTSVPAPGFSPFIVPALVMMVTVYGFAMVVLFAPNVLAVGTVGKSHANGCALEEDEIRKITAEVQRAFAAGAYRNPELTVTSLAEELGVHPRRLSVAVNHAFGRSFPQLVSEARLDYFVEHFETGRLREQTILDLAFEAGFASKSTFNRVFKDRYGSAPSEKTP